jgi:hypothetical protein
VNGVRTVTLNKFVASTRPTTTAAHGQTPFRVVAIAFENAKAYARLSEKITTSEANLVKLDRQLALAKAASARINEIIEERRV